MAATSQSGEFGRSGAAATRSPDDAEATGREPAASCVTPRCSTQLNLVR